MLFRLRKDFKQLLEETGYVTPGKKLEEVRVLFMGRECWEGLPELERQQIYEMHQQDLVLRCKKNFQELLLEKADLFYQFRFCVDDDNGDKADRGDEGRSLLPVQVLMTMITMMEMMVAMMIHINTIL